MADNIYIGVDGDGAIYFDQSEANQFPLNPNGLTNIIRYTGDKSIPRNIRQQRANNLSAMRRFGTPVILKHMYNDDDVQSGLVESSSNRNSVYGQTRRDDPLSYGIGYVSIEKSEDEWIDTSDSSIIKSDTDPNSSPTSERYVRAPKYRGYGPGYLTYAILPDVSQDVFKLSEAGVLIRTQTAQAQMGWYPQVSDNDLMSIVGIDRDEKVVDTRERFVLKQASPMSMRGLDRGGRQEYTENFGNRLITDQQFEMTLLPDNDIKMSISMDR